MSDAIAFASDHAGRDLRLALAEVLRGEGRPVVDLGTDGSDSVDYPDFADLLARVLAEGSVHYGVLICGTGIGISMAANRHNHVRAALCTDATMARLARQHNDANVLVLGARVVGAEVAKDCLTTFLATPFEGGRHAGRVAKLNRVGPTSAPNA